MTRVLYFTPYFAVWDYVRIDMQVVRALKAQGLEVSFLGCDGFAKNMCPAMSAFGLTEVSTDLEKKNVCTTCKYNKNVFCDELGEVKNLDPYLDQADYKSADLAANAISKNEILDFKIEGIPLGRLCLYEISLHLKKQELSFSDEEFEGVRIHFRNVLLTFYAYKKFLMDNSFDAVVMYNTQYSINGAVAYLSEKVGMKVYFTHNGLNISDRNQTLIMGERSTGDFLKKSVEKWNKFPMAAASEADYEYITDHLIELVKGKSIFAYSAQGGAVSSVRDKLKIPDGKKVVIVAMSSGDERMAAEVTGWIPTYERLFSTQVDWARFLLDWIKTRPDLYLVFRVHPREFPNKREQVLSEQAQALKKLFQNMPENAVVNWPEDQISLYDLAEYADLFLNAWSSVGKEMALLGYPVVIFSKDLIWYPADINYLGQTTDDYLKAIDKALAKGWSVDHAIRAYRWMNYEMNLSHVHIENILSKLIIKAETLRKVLKKINPIWALKFDIWQTSLNLKKYEKIGRLIQEEKKVLFDFVDLTETPIHAEDKKSLKKQYQRILAALYPAGKPTKINGLRDKMKSFIDAQ